MFYRNTSINRPYVVTISITLLLLALIGGLVLRRTQGVYHDTVELADNWLPSVEVLNDVRAAATTALKAELLALLEDDPVKRVAHLKKHDSRITRVSALFSEYERLVCSPEDRAYLEADRKKWQNYLVVDQRVAELLLGGQQDAARLLATTTAEAAFHEFAHAADAHLSFNRRGAGDAAATARYSYNSASALIAWSIAISFGLGICTALLAFRSVAGKTRAKLQSLAPESSH